jgi:hypothetical protein
MSKILFLLTTGVLLLLFPPQFGYSHDGELDSYGCHHDKERKDYHCHKGVFKGGSFSSKMEMVRLLKLQFLNLGRPWPYGEVAEEDITSPETTTPP